MLRDNGLDPGLVKADPGATEAPNIGPSRLRDDTVFEEDSSPLATNSDLRDWSQNHLVSGTVMVDQQTEHQVEHETGDFQVYGPTSAFRHLRSNSISEDRKPYSPTDHPSPLQGDFRRFLPDEVHLTEDQHEAALDRFFRYYSSWGASLLKQMVADPLSSADASPAVSRGYATSSQLANTRQNGALFTNAAQRHPLYSPLLRR